MAIYWYYGRDGKKRFTVRGDTRETTTPADLYRPTFAEIAATDDALDNATEKEYNGY